MTRGNQAVIESNREFSCQFDPDRPILDFTPAKKVNIVSFTIANNVNPGDDIWVELYVDEKIQLEVFCHDSDRRYCVRLFTADVDLELVEQCTRKLTDERLWEFTD